MGIENMRSMFKKEEIFNFYHVEYATKLASAQATIREEYDKLRDCSSFSEVAELSPIAAFLGPSELYQKKKYEHSVIESFDGHTSFKGIRGQVINIIPC